MIKILLDQNIHEEILGWLRGEVTSRAEVTSTRLLEMKRHSDEELFYYCQQHQMVIITFDEDFQNPLMIPNIPGYGVVRLNVYPTGIQQTKEALLRLLATYPIETWEYASIVVDQLKIRYNKKMQGK